MPENTEQVWKPTLFEPSHKCVWSKSYFTDYKDWCAMEEDKEYHKLFVLNLIDKGHASDGWKETPLNDGTAEERNEAWKGLFTADLLLRHEFTGPSKLRLYNDSHYLNTEKHQQGRNLKPEPYDLEAERKHGVICIYGDNRSTTVYVMAVISIYGQMPTVETFDDYHMRQMWSGVEEYVYL